MLAVMEPKVVGHCRATGSGFVLLAATPATTQASNNRPTHLYSIQCFPHEQQPLVPSTTPTSLFLGVAASPFASAVVGPHSASANSTDDRCVHRERVCAIQPPRSGTTHVYTREARTTHLGFSCSSENSALQGALCSEPIPRQHRI